MKRSDKKKALELKLATLRNLSVDQLGGIGGGAIATTGTGTCRPSNCGDTCTTTETDDPSIRN